jgi:ferrochelatase
LTIFKREKKVAKAKKAVLLVNLGTPDSPKVPDVRKYLREFLLDRRVIDISAVGRWTLVNGIIAPFRAPKSAKVYRELWDDRGSPLMYYGVDVKNMVREILGPDYRVELAMRYQSPSIASALAEIKRDNPSSILVVPLFPQYASATTGSVIDKVMEIVRKWEVIPDMSFVSQFFEEEGFIEAFARRGRKYLDSGEWDHVLFSYHGLPERQIIKSSVDGYCQLSDKCCATYHQKNRFCYRAQCYQTSRLLAKELGLKDEDYTVMFQSRLGKTPWLQPYAEDVIHALPGRGKKKVLAFSPSFVADCLETTIEVGDEFKEEFMEAGGEQWQLVESLNAEDGWVQFLAGMIRERMAQRTTA